MKHTTLAVKYRPKTFDDVIGQQFIKEVIENQIKQNKMGKAYLYSGPSGTGKTTVARIVADKIDAEILEVDAASNNGVENIRKITENVKYKPLTKSYKVYIIDECHMLSKGAWNALLKTLEEPPAHAIFILCTTEPHKVIPTIISRTQRFNFTRPTTQEITDNLVRIIESEKLDVDYDVLRYIAKLADGGVRLSITMLESCLNAEQELTVPNVENILGYLPTQYFVDILKAVSLKDRDKIISLIEEYYRAGTDFERFIENLVMFTLDLQKYYVTRNMDYLRTSSLYEDDIKMILNHMGILVDKDFKRLDKLIKRYTHDVKTLYYDSQKLEPKRYLLELTLLQMTQINV
jgi:DNA polymerase-3 subunit gamma/tau